MPKITSARDNACATEKPFRYALNAALPLHDVRKGGATGSVTLPQYGVSVLSEKKIYFYQIK
ncbi:MAG: hypothetical protein ABI064_07960 [Acidobacteriaceae bacterium]